MEAFLFPATFRFYTPSTFGSGRRLGVLSRSEPVPSTSTRSARASPTMVRMDEQGGKSQDRLARSRSAQGSIPPPLSARDALELWIENILVLYGNKPPRDCAPLANGDIRDLTGRKEPFFLALHRYFENTGPVYKLAFGPKVFIVVQDPVICRHILRENSHLYDKGVLAEILEDIMGKGLIPADFATWKHRRRALVPGFHAAWLSYMTGMFSSCTQTLCDKLHELAAASSSGSAVVDMEAEYCSLALDIIGKAVFSYEFGSVTKESPIIKAVYRVLREAEARSLEFVPYWKIPGVSALIPRQRRFRADMQMINGVVNSLIRLAKETQVASDIEELERRDYSSMSDPSILRFLVDLRGEETTNKQLRDDLVTLLVAGHETTGAALTWTTFELAQRPDIIQKAREEIDRVLQDRHPTYQDVRKLGYVRRIMAEALRLYPQPPLLIRRLLADDTLPKGGSGAPTALRRGTDVFINVYSLHRSPDLWENPTEFDPDRWLRPHTNPGVEGWKGYAPAAGLDVGSPLYPNEQHADFAFLPFGGGTRKCIGDQFAVLETVVALAMILRRFDIALVEAPENMKMDTGATIHCREGLQMKLTPRKSSEKDIGVYPDSGLVTQLAPSRDPKTVNALQ